VAGDIGPGGVCLGPGRRQAALRRVRVRGGPAGLGKIGSGGRLAGLDCAGRWDRLAGLDCSGSWGGLAGLDCSGSCGGLVWLDHRGPWRALARRGRDRACDLVTPRWLWALACGVAIGCGSPAVVQQVLRLVG
jgi:hypothetical protein